MGLAAQCLAIMFMPVSVESIFRTANHCQRPSKAAQVWPSKIAHLAEVTSL